MLVYGNIMNRIGEQSRQKAPVIGDGATMTAYSDRYAGTIIKVTAVQVHVQRDGAKRADSNGMSESQSYEYECDSSGTVSVFRRRKNGRYRATDGCGLIVGHRDEYHDYSF